MAHEAIHWPRTYSKRCCVLASPTKSFMRQQLSTRAIRGHSWVLEQELNRMC